MSAILRETRGTIDRVVGGLHEVRQLGYRIVVLHRDDVTFAEPELVPRDNHFYARLKARAASLHLL